MNITSKSNNYDKYQRGLYGNKLRTWNSLNDYFKSNYSGTVTLRYKGQSGAGFCAYEVQQSQVKSVVNEWLSKGANKSLIVVNESAPDNSLTIQGEVTIDHTGYSLFYSKEQGKMRDCLKHGIQVSGLQAKLLMQQYMSASSYSDLQELLELYPEHVIEFSTYDRFIGSCRGRNTIIWEVRKY